MADSNKDVHVRTTDEAAAKIKEEVFKFLDKIIGHRGCESVTKEMVEFCKARSGVMLEQFGAANRGGATQKAFVFEKVVAVDDRDWSKSFVDCQLVIEIDADEPNPRLGQSGHLGGEIYFANKEECARAQGNVKEIERIGRRLFKMHAYLPAGEKPPHCRHESDRFEEETFSSAGSNEVVKDKSSKHSKTVTMYRGRVRRVGRSQKPGQQASILIR